MQKMSTGDVLLNAMPALFTSTPISPCCNPSNLQKKKA